MQKREQLIKTYSGWTKNGAAKKFTKEAAKLSREGWFVQSQSMVGDKPYFTRVLTVVYVRGAQQS